MVSAQVWKASDGSEWATKDEADRQERLLKAAEEYREASDRFAQAIAETQKTADGHPLDLDATHYRTRPGCCEVEAVRLLRWKHVEIRENGTVAFYQPDFANLNYCSPSVLFRDKKEAGRAAAKELRQRIADLEKRANKLEDEA